MIIAITLAKRAMEVQVLIVYHARIQFTFILFLYNIYYLLSYFYFMDNASINALKIFLLIQVHNFAKIAFINLRILIFQLHFRKLLIN